MKGPGPFLQSQTQSWAQPIAELEEEKQVRQVIEWFALSRPSFLLTTL